MCHLPQHLFEQVDGSFLIVDDQNADNRRVVWDHSLTVAFQDLANHVDEMGPAERIRTTLAEGVVTLEGTVDSRAEREEAAFAIRRLAAAGGTGGRPPCSLGHGQQNNVRCGQGGVDEPTTC